MASAAFFKGFMISDGRSWWAAVSSAPPTDDKLPLSLFLFCYFESVESRESHCVRLHPPSRAILKRFVAGTAVFALQVDFRLAVPADSVLLDLLVHCHHRPGRTGVFSMR